MISLVETGLMNALLAVALALPILILGRIWHRPALVHAFWILVLIKLVSPPLYQVQLPWQLPAWPTVEAAKVVPSPPLPTVAAASGATELVIQPQSIALGEPRSGSNLAFRYVAENVWYCLGMGIVLLQGVLAPALFIWLVGSVCWFTWQGWRVVRFAQVFLRSAQPAPESLQQQARILAQQMGMKHAPQVWLLPAVVSPMLWAVGGKPRILFPGELLSRLDDCAVATLLTHELAHYRRGDHHVRMLEFLASGLFWWHPLVWVARRELEISEEQCCDAWVVSQFPASQRRYADALLATVDFLSEEHPPMPALASGLGDVPMLRQRLTLIMCGTAPKSLSAVGRLSVILTALLIPISPSIRANTPDSISPKFPAIATPTSSVHQRNLDRLQARTARLTQELDTLTQAVRASQSQRPSPPPVQPDISVEPSPANNSGPSIAVPDAKPQATSKFSIPCAVTNETADRGMRSSQSLNHGRVESSFRHRVWANATAPNCRSRVIAWTNGIVQWQGAGPGEIFDLSPYRVSTILYSADGDIFFTGCRDGIVRAWDASNCQLLFKLEGHQGSVRAIALSPEGNCLATADQQGLVLLWSFDDKSGAKRLTRSPSAVNSLAFSADGQSLALGTGNWFSPDPAQVQVWDLGTDCLRACLDHQSPLAVVKLSPDGKSVSGAEWNGTLLTWDLESSAIVSKRQINRFTIPAATFAPQS